MLTRNLLTLVTWSCATLLYGQPTFAPGQNPQPDGKVWLPVEQMSDEFESQALNQQKWQSEPLENGWRWVGRPPALFKASNVRLEDGKMKVTVGKLAKPVLVSGKNYTHQGAIIRSITAGQPGWYFECKMKANQTEMSSTFWLKTPPRARKNIEMDIQECVGRTSDKAKKWSKGWDQIFHSNIFYNLEDKSRKRIQLQQQMTPATKNHERFYVYGAWWKDPKEVRFYLDGEYTYSLQPEVAWDVPSHIIMAIETYDWNPLPDDGGLVESGTTEQRTTQYEWVRTWKLVSEKSIPNQKL